MSMHGQAPLYTSCTVLAVLLCNAATADETRHREFTVRDSVEMSFFGNVQTSNPKHSYDDGVVAPNCRYVARMTQRGVLPEGHSEGTIWLFDTQAVLAAVNDQNLDVESPLPVVRMAATVNGQTTDFDDRGNILLQLKWSVDCDKLYFIGRNGSENRQLFELEIESQAVRSISLPGQNVMSYLLGRDSVVYLTSPYFDERQEWLSAGPGIPDIVVGTGTPLIQMLYPNFRGYAVNSPLILTAWRETAKGPEAIKETSTGLALEVESNFTDVAGLAAKGTGYDSLVDRLSLNSDWVPLEGNSQGADNRLELSVKESLNQPPVLVATDNETGNSRQILDPNPQLANIAMAEVRVFEWQDKHGRTHFGGLAVPASHEKERRYPLVIQTHGFNKARFFKAGYSATANAGRALAGRGIVVLQVQEPWPEGDGVYDPARLGSDVYLGAVDALDEAGLVNRDKVGITGYSFSGWLAADAITREPDRFAAAVIANTDPLSLTGYFSYVDSPLHGLVEPTYVGAAPFGEGLNKWLERSPNFNTDKITAPVLVAALDPFHLISLWDLYAALRYQGKPVELQFMRTGKHNVGKPLQVLAHQELIVDWFAFWLNQTESSSQEKSAQYARWRALRDITPGAASGQWRP